MAVSLLFVWLLAHRYYGIYDDAVLYNLQAIARIHPELYGNDIFLRYGSQDSFTIFTRLYATLIEGVGVAAAGVAVVLFFTAWFYCAAFCVARALASAEMAWLAVGILIVVPASYGGFNIFKAAEEFVSARLPAEALLLTAVAALLHGRRTPALVLTGVAALVHPLMALPVAALLVLLGIRQEWRSYVVALAATVLALICAVAFWAPFAAVSLMDTDWLRVVELRSNYLFLENWPLRSLERVVLVLATLAMIWITSEDERIRRTMLAATTVTVGGLFATLVTTAVPVVILLQIQPWRAMWITTVLAILLLPVCVVASWRSRIGRSAALMLIAAWCLFDISPHSCWLVLFALALWMTRDRIPQAVGKYVALLAWGMTGVVVIWAVGTAVSALSTDLAFGQEPAIAERVRTMFGLPASAALVVVASWLACVRARTPVARGLVMAALLVATPTMAAVARAQWVDPLREEDPRRGFEDWRAIIPEGSQVMWFWKPLPHGWHSSAQATCRMHRPREWSFPARQR